MSVNHPERQHYTEILEYLKTCFPYPVSNPVMDGNFVHTLSRFLDRLARRGEIHAVVLPERLVLGGDDGVDDDLGHLVERDVLPY